MGVLCTFWLRNVLRATTACTFSTSQLPEVVWAWCALYILTSKCASRHNSAHFFGHLNFQKWSEHGVLCTFWLGNVLRATTACNCSSLIWPAGSAPAALASLLFDPPEPQTIGKTQCFATFLPFRAPASSLFWLFLFSDLLSAAILFSSLTLTTSAFHLSILSEVWLELLNFLRPIGTSGPYGVSATPATQKHPECHQVPPHPATLNAPPCHQVPGLSRVCDRAVWGSGGGCGGGREGEGEGYPHMSTSSNKSEAGVKMEWQRQERERRWWKRER